MQSRVLSALAVPLIAGALVLGACRTAVAASIGLVPNSSIVDLDVDVSVFGGALTATQQCTGCLTTRYDGNLNASFDMAAPSFWFDGGGAADARQQVGSFNIPRQISPGLGGGSGTAPADYGVTLSAPVGTALPPIEIPDLGTLNLGTLQSVDMRVALRNVVLDAVSTSFLDVTAGAYDASEVTVLLSANVDVLTALVLRAPDLATYFVNLLALQALATSVPDLGVTVSGNLFTRDISLGLGFGSVLVDQPIANAATGGTLTTAGLLGTLTLPIDLSVTPAGLQGFFDLQIGLQGQLVGTGIVPEPSTLLLAGLGLGGLAARARRDYTRR